ncbi:unnamed protein product [Phaedon cochleariae]|uniref:RRM domain-containing protein n=1 Tax=Phaedon cochleariae TaxID=80249 RepID=A0A9P0GQM7_PHACE|nr:unnamed protein product [Phaedon cochleariae]
MDIDLFRDEEQFSTFEDDGFLDPYPDIPTGLDIIHNFAQNEMYEWNMDNEREINGDIALIPMCDMNLTKLNDSTPCKDDFQKIINDLHQFISVDSSCTDFAIEEPIVHPEENEDEMATQKSSAIQDILTLPNIKNFDIASYLTDPDQSKPAAIQTVPIRKPKAGVKKIDLKAQRYIVDDEQDEIDVETVSECGESSPVLEAGDLDSLLEQFEATQIPKLPEDFIENDPSVFEFDDRHQLPQEDTLSVNNCIDEDTVYKKPDSIYVNKECNYETKVNVKIEQEDFEIGESVLIQPDAVNVKTEFLDEDIVKVKREQNSDNIKNHNSKKDKTVFTQKDRVELKEEWLHNSPDLDYQTNFQEAHPVHGTHCMKMKISCLVSAEPHTSFAKQPPKPEPLARRRHSEKPAPSNLSHSKDAPRTPKASRPLPTPDSTTSCTPPVPIKNKQIIDCLPQELINRIKQSGKRKTISVIDPVLPTKKRGHHRDSSGGPKAAPLPPSGLERVRLDHDYCASGGTGRGGSGGAGVYPKHPKMDSGFESAEEEEQQRAVMGGQPMVKNADGKLMVSLLKVNSIHPTDANKKKKLNLEEYKKRRVGFLSQGGSPIRSPAGSSCGSPQPEDENTRRIRHQEKISSQLEPEDENTRRIRHQEKLMRMALEVLNTPPKKEVKREEEAVVVTPPKPVTIPADMEKKTLVSVGVNTDFRVRRKNLDPLAPVEQLDEIKPLLQQASTKINSSSLITSVIENIPKVIDSCDVSRDAEQQQPQRPKGCEHGEDKTIVYLPRNRAAVSTSSVECQTNISLIQQSKASRYRRRRSSSSSSSCSSTSSRGSSRSSSRYNRRRRRSSNSSCSSSRSSRSSQSSLCRRSSSRYSSRSFSRSRSRSLSPRYRRKEKERHLEVEERRVIYVGRVPPGTTKEDLKKRFHRFGPITNVSLHSRDHGYLDNYGFVTFANKLDAYEAIEHGNDDPWQPKYDLSFGGRRIFCQTTYSDLDNMRDESGYYQQRGGNDSFDNLLREVQEKLRKRKA